jgi:hypothetical protein
VIAIKKRSKELITKMKRKSLRAEKGPQYWENNEFDNNKIVLYFGGTNNIYVHCSLYKQNFKRKKVS